MDTRNIIKVNPQAFISWSFDNEYAAQRAFFSDLVESCGFEPRSLDIAIGAPVADKIRGAIESCKVLVAFIFTRPSDYILNEIGMAYSLNKRIVVVRAGDAQLGGIAQHVTDWITFDPRTYWTIAPQVVRLLTKFYLEYQESFSNSHLIIRKHARSLIDISPSSVENTTEINLLNLSDRLTEVNHGLILYNDLERTLQGHDSDFEVQVLSPVMSCNVTTWSSETSLNARIAFERPLLRGDSVLYMYRQRLPNYFPMTKDQLRSLSPNERLRGDDAHCEKSYTISTPTEFLDLRLSFPAGYRIYDERVSVTYYKADIILETEITRIRTESLFRREEFAGVVTLQLRVPYPKLFARYSIQWKPYA
jgi:hypothetical protein